VGGEFGERSPLDIFAERGTGYCEADSEAAKVPSPLDGSLGRFFKILASHIFLADALWHSRVFLDKKHANLLGFCACFVKKSIADMLISLVLVLVLKIKQLIN